MASPFLDVLEKMLDENEDDHDNSDDKQNRDEDSSGHAGKCSDGSGDYRNLMQCTSDISFPDDDQSDQGGSDENLGNESDPVNESKELFSGSDED